MATHIAIVTGSRAEFGLLAPVISAIGSHKGLEASVVVAGAHLLGPAETWREVDSAFDIAARVEMQRDGETGRGADALALGRGVTNFARTFGELSPDCVLVLGDRIEAFAAASAASVGGIAVAHVHGGDRAEGVADEAMRHAITKLAHVHFPATRASAERITQMGEEIWRVHVTGSPAAIGIDEVEARAPGEIDPAVRVIVMMHPAGLGAGEDEAWTDAAIEGALSTANAGERVAVFDPNMDPGREGVLAAIERAASRGEVDRIGHLGHKRFRRALRWLASVGGATVGNSSAGLIEAPMLGLASVTVGPRQAGRERPAGVLRVELPDADAIAAAISAARVTPVDPNDHPYGDGTAHEQIADVLAGMTFGTAELLRKRNGY
jgi:UDP-hydrolysing UDP-N-acetyl-D-glucosamine 2-epimerase